MSWATVRPEVKVTLEKISGQWLITRVETIRVLSGFRPRPVPDAFQNTGGGDLGVDDYPGGHRRI